VKTEALGELSEEELGLGLLCFAAGQATRGSRCGKRGLGQEGVRPHAHAEAAGRGRAYPARGGRGRGGGGTVLVFRSLCSSELWGCVVKRLLCFHLINIRTHALSI
jgi:hypothetical protein